MPNLNENTSRTINRVTAFIDYVPAELRKGKDWMIVYYAKNPFTDELERFRVRAPQMSNTRARELHAKKIAAEITRKLSEERWSPFMDKPGNKFKTFKDATDGFLNLIGKEFKDGIKRADTIRAYTSYISLIHKYIEARKVKIKFAGQFDLHFVTGYLDWIYYDRNNSPTTYNNHLRFIKSLSNHFISRGFIVEDPTQHIKRKPKTKKIRTIIDDASKEIIRQLLPQFSYEYFVLCMIPYYTMIRRTELTKLKRINIDLENDVITIPGDSSKNRITESATIPLELKPLLIAHFQDAAKDDYVFSADGFKPGKELLKPKKITDTWTKFRKEAGLPLNIQWYSFKDSGITDLFMLGSLSAIQIRDQARHKDLKITELYTAQTIAGDLMVKNSGAKF